MNICFKIGKLHFFIYLLAFSETSKYLFILKFIYVAIKNVLGQYLIRELFGIAIKFNACLCHVKDLVNDVVVKPVAINFMVLIVS